MPIVELDGLPSWSLDVRETGESTKCPWIVVVGFIATKPTATTHGHFVLPPVSFASRDQDGGPLNNDRHLRSHGKIGGCEQSILKPG